MALTLDIVTPERRVLSVTADEVRAPGVTMSRVSAIGYPAASFFAFSTASSMPPTM